MQRREQLAIRAAASRDLLRLWPVVDPVNLTGTMPEFLPAAVVVTQARRAESARSAADYYQQFAVAERETPVPPVLAAEADEDHLASTLRGAALAGIVRARRAGFPPAAALRHGLVSVQGSASDVVLGGGRETLAATAAADGRAQGWRRVTSSDPCPFCRDMAAELDSG